MGKLKLIAGALRAAYAAFIERVTAPPYHAECVDGRWYIAHYDGTLVGGERSYPTQSEAEWRVERRVWEESQW